MINCVIATSLVTFSVKRGATSIRISEELLVQYLENIIVPEIDEKKAESTPILTSQALKFLIIFRNYVPQDWLPSVLEKLTTFLTHESIVVRTYSACAIDKLLSMKDPKTNANIFTSEIVTPQLPEILKQLNLLISESEGLQSYALMSLFRVANISKDAFADYAEGFSDAIKNFIEKAIKDEQSTAYSIYILFETMGN